MTELINMSRKELDRASLLSQVLTKKLTQVQAAKLVGLSDRQLRNLLKDYKRYGPEALVSKKRGKPSNRRLEPPFKENVMQLVRSRYEDFGPTLAAEKLWENHQVKISKETLRQWMISGHLWIGKTQQKKLHPLRQRRMCFGEMLQGDGSHHDWFETGEFCCLMFFIDDATSRITAARFETEETLNGYFAILHEHVLCFGVPRTIYTDRFSVFESSMKKENLTQFRKALTGLEIEWIGANSPQAKGRIERCNRTLQDRLVKEMRLRGIKTIEDGNQFLKQFLPIYNRKFSKEPMQSADLHRPLERGADLSRILSKCEERTITKDFLFQFHNKFYQIMEPTNGCVQGAKVEIRIAKDGKLRIFRGPNELAFKSLDEIMPKPVPVDLNKLWHNSPSKERDMNHPWKSLSYRKNLKEKEVKEYNERWPKTGSF